MYEIARLLRRERARLGDPAAQKRMLARIVSDYSWKAPADLLAAIKESLAE